MYFDHLDFLFFLKLTESARASVRTARPLHPTRDDYGGKFLCFWFEFLQTTNVKPSFVDTQTLMRELVSSIDGQLKPEVTHVAAFYEHRLQLGQKPIFHLEAFVAKFMAIYKKFVMDEVGVAGMFDDWQRARFYNVQTNLHRICVRLLLSILHLIVLQERYTGKSQ